MCTKSRPFWILIVLVIFIPFIVACSENRSQPTEGASPSSGDAVNGGGEPELTIRLATNGGPGNMLHDSAYEYAKRIEEKSNGKIKVNVFANSQLGTDLAVMDAANSGSIEMVIVSTALTQKAPEFGVFDIPFLFADRTKVKQFSESDVWQNELKSLLPEHGLVGLGFFENGYRQISNNVRPIHTPEDLEGINIRVPDSRIRIAMFEEFGANPSPLDFSELFTALQQGVYDAQESPMPAIVGSALHEVQQYLSITNHVYSPCYLLASQVWWDTLSPEHQQIFEEVAIETGDWSRDAGQQADDELVDFFKENGVEVNDADIPSFQARIAPVVDIMKENIDPDFVDRVIEAAK
ncbi:TRAP transporter substrate-binding protein [Halalkalibacter oceani]|uniref:TRAP transporter substrate-binding protein n=1 Tax=Halalkalibacter oceani TaxID=1653776 RepID=A0A9X2DQY3_9BACI|nr:TRAP transporter substrate-binding protein [Halalkalibacter oceani]MCM3714782.1 TRAP transporter substrate-binding protein [Halalkalibacter oceani]